MADNIDADKLAVLEALLCKERERRLGEEPLEIITGVPDADDNAPKGKAKADTALRVDDFSARRQVSEALSAVNKPMPTSPPPASGFEEPAEPLEEHHIWAQVAAPTDTNPGAIIEGNFTFQDGVVQRPWEAYQISRALWFAKYRWTPKERMRWRHREQA
jgi:hypothetical protein